MPRKFSPALTRTYLTPAMIKTGKGFHVRFVDTRTGEESRASRSEATTALEDARKKILRKSS